MELQDGADFNDPAAPRHWTPDHIAALASSPLAGRLTSLELPPWDGFLEPLAGWPAGGPLDKLQVFGSVPRPRPPVGGRLAALPLAARVRELNLGMSDMGDADLEALVAGRWPRLTRLALWMNDLTARAAAALGRSPGLPALTNLDLSHNPIADARLLVPLAFRLTRLNLSDTRLTDAGATALLAAADGPLERLDVASNPLSARCRRRLTAAFGDRVRVDHRTYPPGWVGP